MARKQLTLGKIYTRGGDKGTTALVGGKRVQKSSQKIETYGTVDELISAVGVVRTYAALVEKLHPEVHAETRDVFRVVQNKLFDVGSILATPVDTPYEGMPRILAEDVKFLEKKIDHYNKILTVLHSFTLPGGGLLNAHAHMARTICRRAERELFRLGESEPVDAVVYQYINRLSDYLFVYTRWVSIKLGEEEFLWERGL